MSGKNDRETTKKIIKALLLSCWPLGFALYWVSAANPELIDKLHLKEFSQNTSQFLTRVTGVFDFSIAEVSLWFLIIAIVAVIVRFIVKLIIETDRLREIRCFISFLFSLVIISGVVNLFYVGLWGINYNHSISKDNMAVKVSDYSVIQLELLGKELIDRANILREDLIEDERGVMKIEGGFDTIKRWAPLAFSSTKTIFPQLEGRYYQPKPLYTSKLVSRTGLLGIYIPFTGEANINVDIPHCIMPATVCHEMAHQKGFAGEDEANYIAWVVCAYDQRPEYKYSGTIHALIYVMNALSQKAPIHAELLKKDYGEGLLRDLYALENYWNSHESKAKQFASDLNDLFLKSNGQEAGVKSYEQIVDRMLDEPGDNQEHESF